jgi:hypothetical protein
LLLAVSFALLTLVQAQASAATSPASTVRAGWSGAGCGEFELTQTYRNWGPAVTYGRPVTVHYEATRCSRAQGGTVQLSIEGQATVYRGWSVTGEPLDQRAFAVRGHWTNPSNQEGWPPDWWQCDVKSAEYSWRIPGVYTFDVSASQGVWSLDVSAGQKTVTWTYDACG